MLAAHGGSALRLALMLSVANGSLVQVRLLRPATCAPLLPRIELHPLRLPSSCFPYPQALYWPFSGIPLPYVAAALPLAMALPLASSRRLCLRLIEDGSAKDPLETLHSLLGAAQ